MDSNTIRFGLLLVAFGATNAQAADLDKMDGLQLYNKECSVCHGNLAQKTGDLAPRQVNRRPVQVAMSALDGPKPDVAAPLSSEWYLPRHGLAGAAPAVGPISGPPLTGGQGRAAG